MKITIPPRYKRGMSLWLVAAILNIFVVGIATVFTYHNHQHDQEKAASTAENVSRILSDDLVRLLEKIDLTLQTAQDELARQEGEGGIRRAELEAFLARHDARLPETQGLRIFNAQGVIDYAASHTPTLSVNLADQAFFRLLKETPAGGMVISPPLVDSTQVEPLIILARRRQTREGEFTGIVSLAVPVKTLITLLAKAHLGLSGSVGLWDKTPVLLARFAFSNLPTSGLTTPSPTLRGLIAHDPGPTHYRANSGVDGLERLFYFRRVGDWPIYLIVGLSETDFMADWRQQQVVMGTLCVLFLLISTGSVFLILRAMKALERAKLAADRARRRSDIILNSAGEGICGVGKDGRLSFINKAALTMLGWHEGDLPRQSFHELSHHHHPDGSPYPVQECPIHQLLVSGETSLCQCQRVENEVYWRRDGTSFPVEYTVSPLEEDGRLVGVVNVFRDVTPHKLAENRLLFVNESLRLLNNIAALPQGSLKSRLKEALQLGCEHLGLELGIVSHVTGQDYRVEFCATPPGHPMHDDDLFELGNTYCQITLSSQSVIAIRHMAESEYARHPCYKAFQLECYMGVPLLVDGKVYGTVNFSSALPYARAFDEADFEFMRLLGRWVGAIIAEEHQKAQLVRLATTDPLTGLANRRKFMEAAAEEVERIRRYARPLCLLMLDIDHFKVINDTYGHDAGDEALRVFSNTVQANLRDTDLAGRLGGEEFAVLLVETDITGALDLANRLRQAVADIQMVVNDKEIRFTVSIGVSGFQPDDGVERLLHRADLALYEAKGRGRNQVICASPSQLPLQ